MKLRAYRRADVRLRIVRTAEDLFHRLGIRSTTTDEIIEAAGVAKSQFHQHFKSKEELASAVLRYHIEQLAAGTGRLNYRLDTWSDLQECFASHVEFQKRFRMTRGCPIARLASELSDEDELVRHHLNRMIDLMITGLECLFSREKVAGRLASTVDVEQLANFCVVMIQGAMLTGKIRINCRSVESILEDLLGHLKRYVKVPTRPKKQLDRDRRTKHSSALPKAPVPTTVVELCDPQNPGASAEDHSIDGCRPEDGASRRASA